QVESLCDERVIFVVNYRDVEIEVSPLVGSTPAERAGEPCRDDARIGLKCADDTLLEIIAAACVGGEVAEWFEWHDDRPLAEISACTRQDRCAPSSGPAR